MILLILLAQCTLAGSSVPTVSLATHGVHFDDHLILEQLPSWWNPCKDELRHCLTESDDCFSSPGAAASWCKLLISAAPLGTDRGPPSLSLLLTPGFARSKTSSMPLLLLLAISPVLVRLRVRRTATANAS